MTTGNSSTSSPAGSGSSRFPGRASTGRGGAGRSSASISPRRTRLSPPPPPASPRGISGFPAEVSDPAGKPTSRSPLPAPVRRLHARAARRHFMNATDLLKEDHDRLKEMFDEFRGLDGGNRREKQRLFRRIASALEVHAEIEERFFYPAVRGTRREDAVEITFEAFEEHKIARTLIGQIESLPKGD